MLLPGILASGITGNLSTNNFTSIATATVDSGGASSITFSSIPSTYTHLQIRMIGQGTSSGASNICPMTFNGSSTGYYMHQIYGEGSAAHANADNTSTSIDTFYITGSSQSTVWGGGVMDILDYANTNKYKVTRTFSGNNYNSGGLILTRSGLWQNTAAITSISFTTNSNFAQYTQFALYGVK